MIYIVSSIAGRRSANPTPLDHTAKAIHEKEPDTSVVAREQNVAGIYNDEAGRHVA